MASEPNFHDARSATPHPVPDDITSVQDLFDNPKTPRASLAAEEVRREQIAKAKEKRQHGRARAMTDVSSPSETNSPLFPSRTPSVELGLAPPPPKASLEQQLLAVQADWYPSEAEAAAPPPVPPRAASRPRPMPLRSSSILQSQKSAAYPRLPPSKPPRDIRRPSFEASLSPIQGSIRDDVGDDESRPKCCHVCKIPRRLDPFTNPRHDGSADTNAVDRFFTPRPTSSPFAVDGVADKKSQRQESPTRIPQPSKWPSNHTRQSSGAGSMRSLPERPVSTRPAKLIVEIDTPPETPSHALDEPITVPFNLIDTPVTPSHKDSGASVEKKSGATNSSGETYDSLRYLRQHAQLVNSRRLLYAQQMHYSVRQIVERSPGAISMKSSASSPGGLSELSASPQHRSAPPTPVPRTYTCGAINSFQKTAAGPSADFFGPIGVETQVEKEEPGQSLSASTASPVPTVSREMAVQGEDTRKTGHARRLFSRIRNTLIPKRFKGSLVANTELPPKQSNLARADSLPKTSRLASLRQPKSIGTLQTSAKQAVQPPKIPERRNAGRNPHHEQPPLPQSFEKSGKQRASRPIKSLPNIRGQGYSDSGLIKEPTRTPPRIPVSILRAENVDEAYRASSASPSEQRRQRRDTTRARGRE